MKKKQKKNALVYLYFFISGRLANSLSCSSDAKSSSSIKINREKVKKYFLIYKEIKLINDNFKKKL